MKNISAKVKKIYEREGMCGMLKRVGGVVRRKMIPFEPLLLSYALAKIKKLEQDLDVKNLIDFAFTDMGGIIRPTQLVEEITGLLDIVRQKRPKIILEIGTDRGGTLFLFTRVAPEDATIISIDLPPQEGGYPAWRERLYKTFTVPHQTLHLLRGNSHHPQTLEKVKSILGGQKIDFIFIDADHTYDGVKKDFEIYRDLVKAGGIIAFHDIAVHPFDKNCKVNEFWDEIKKNYKYQELIQNPDRLLYGIGILELQ